MDYRKAWDRVKSLVEDAVEEGQFNGYNGSREDMRVYGMYQAYDRILNTTVELESEGVSEEIAVGDKVRVVNVDVVYPSYRDWVKKNIDNPFLALRWAVSRSLGGREIGVVKCLAPHGTQEGVIIAYIQIGDACYMIDVAGLEKI